MTQRLKIIFAIGAMHGGGSERQMVSLLRELDRERFEPHLYLVYRSGPLLEQIPGDVNVVAFEERCPAKGAYFPGRNHRRRVNDFAAYLQEVGADVVYDRTFLMTLISAEGAQRANVPNVATIVTDPSLGFAPVAGRFQWWKKRLLRNLYSHSTFALANSEGSARSAERFYGLKANSVLVHANGVDLTSLRQTAQQPINDSWWKADDDAFRIVTAGRLNHEKGFHLLIDALAELRNQNDLPAFKLAILGEGTHREILQQQIEALGLQQTVKLLGFQQDAAAWYASANLFVLPSFLEGMPNVLLESMAVGTPVISTDCPSGPAEILQNGDFGTLIEPRNTSALVQSISEAIRARNQPEREAVTTAARQHVEAQYSIEVACRKLEGWLTEAARR